MVASGSQHLLLDVASLEGVEWLLFLAIRAAVLSSQQLLFFQQCMAKTGIPALHVWQWETLKPGTNHRKNVISWRMDLSFSLAVHTDEVSVPWHPRGELLWSPALSSKMLCTPFLLIISLIRACKMLWRMMPKCLRAPAHFRGSPLFLPYRHLCPSHLIDLGKWALSIWDQS